MPIDGLVFERGPRWEWAVEPEVFHGTAAWPELLGIAGVLVLAATCWLGARRRAPVPEPHARVVAGCVALGPIAAALVGVVVVPASEGFAPGLWAWMLTVVAVGFAAAGALLFCVARDLSGRAVVGLAVGGALTLAPPLHAGWVSTVFWPTVDVHGSPHQHVGLDQEVRGALTGFSAPAPWRMTRARQVVSGDRAGVTAVSLVAEGGLEHVRRRFEVTVGEERGDPALPLAEGHACSPAASPRPPAAPSSSRAPPAARGSASTSMEAPPSPTGSWR
ncbi:MAG TPA: hypothetical protein RMH99_21905 [Sandaracinaceae bacterium LLY-WYZ-13_1]|nr:hypothetical protein [Sandaracinaceae bacterium LLY-WYZ-13_1]